MAIVQIPAVALSARVENFFDRAAVRQALTKMEYAALTKGSMRIKDYAKRSIKKMGMAKPKLKIMRDNPGITLREDESQPRLNKRQKMVIQQRAYEIKTRPGSKPGTPPHTHVPYGHMLGFRRNLWNFFDHATRSAVVGPSHKGKRLPYLHEFGGSQLLTTWEFVPQYPRSAKRIIWKLPVGVSPRNEAKWIHGGRSPKRELYPPRPFMQPALAQAIRKGDLARGFLSQFRASVGQKAGLGNL